jgi:hypothetical protein
MNAKIFALDDEDINSKACGRIVFWKLAGPVNRDALAAALLAEGSPIKPPESTSPTVALHRAVDAVAAKANAQTHGTRDKWAIVGRAHEETNERGKKQLVYDVITKATLEGGRPRVEGPHAEAIQTAFEEELRQLAPADLGAWYCKVIDRLGAVALRESGGFYFLPQDVAPKWEAVQRAVAASSRHVISAIPALRSAEAVDAILTAIAADTEAACTKIATEIQGDLGRRALESRERETAELLARVERYEHLLGRKLDALRDATRSTRAAVATAMLALGADDAE